MNPFTVLSVIAATTIALPAWAHSSTNCEDELNFIAIEHLETMQWKSTDVSERAAEFLQRSDEIRLSSLIAYIDAYQMQWAKGMLPLIVEFLKCIHPKPSASTSCPTC